MANKNKFSMSISVDEKTRGKLQTYAASKGISVSAAVTEWVRSLDVVEDDNHDKKGIQRLKHLARMLGNGFGIANVDFENVIYKDFGNGYNVEICNLYRERSPKEIDTSKLRAHIHLWRGIDDFGCKHLATAYHVPFDKIVDEVNCLYEYSVMLENVGDDTQVEPYVPHYGVYCLIVGSDSYIEKTFKETRAEMDTSKAEFAAKLQTLKHKAEQVRE